MQVAPPVTTPSSTATTPSGLVKNLTTKILKSFRFPQGEEDSGLNGSKAGKSGKFGYGNATSRFWIWGKDSDKGEKSEKVLKGQQGTFARATSKFWNNLTSNRFASNDVEDEKDKDKAQTSSWLTKTKSVVSQFALKIMRKEVRWSVLLMLLNEMQDWWCHLCE